MLFSFIFSYLENFFVVFYLCFYFILSSGASARDTGSHSTFASENTFSAEATTTVACCSVLEQQIAVYICLTALPL